MGSNTFCQFLPKTEKPILPEKTETKKKSFIDDIVPFFEKKEIQKEVAQKTTVECHSDLLSMHNSVLEILKKKTTKSLEEKSKKLEWIQNNSIHEIERIQAKRELFQIKREIKATEDGRELKLYIDKTHDIIEEYKNIKPEKSSFVFSETNASQELKKNLLERYKCIARQYIDINTAVKQQVRKLCCPSCNGSDFQFYEDDTYVCSNCCICVQLVDESHSYKDIDRINLSSRYTYTRKGHFIEAINKFQGKQNTTIKQYVFDIIHEEMNKHGLVRVTDEQLMLFLSDHGLSKHYEDITLLKCSINGDIPPDISEYETILLTRFDQQDRVYEKVKDPERINSLNVYYKLMKLLELEGYKCSISDFSMLKKDKLGEHDEIWSVMCEELGWQFIPSV